MFLVEQFPRLRSVVVRYAVPICAVALAAVGLAYANEVLRSPGIAVFMAAIAVSSVLGFGPGATAVLTATLLTDLFFVPTSMSVGRMTWIVASNYVGVMLVARLGGRFVQRKLSQRFLFEKLAAKESGRVIERPRLVGRVDGAVAGELYGWAIDSDQPNSAPKVTFYVDGRPMGEILAVHYRPDVDRHSFFFDLTTCSPPKSSAQVEARFYDGTRLSNCPLTLKIPPRSAPRHLQTVLFMHIAKTAGTAFREAIIENYKHSQVAYLYPHPPGFLICDLGVLPLEQRARFQLVIGHFLYGVHRFLPQESTYVTIVRDPVERVISHYYYLLETEPELVTDGDSILPLPEMMDRRRTVNLDNLMVRCFSGVEKTEVPPGNVNQRIYDLALGHLRTKFKFVGYQDRADEAYTTLQKQFNWDPKRSLEMVNLGGQSRTAVDPSVRKAVEDFNHWDIQLYSEIRRLFS